jgi:exo-poly-alpha-galacturonosidase
MPYRYVVPTQRKQPLALTLAATLTLVCSAPSWALEAPAKLQVPALAYDDQQIILVWEKPADHADISDYRVYANGVLLGGQQRQQ